MENELDLSFLNEEQKARLAKILDEADYHIRRRTAGFKQTWAMRSITDNERVPVAVAQLWYFMGYDQGVKAQAEKEQK